MKPLAEMIEGPEAWTRFRTAVQAVLKVRKSDMPPTPFGKSGKNKKKAGNPEGLVGFPFTALLSRRFLIS